MGFREPEGSKVKEFRESEVAKLRESARVGEYPNVMFNTVI